MRSAARPFLAMLAITAISAAAAGWAGVRYGLHEAAPVDIDAAIHRDLNLTADQERQIAVLEADLARERTERQLEMRAANRDLARAITQHHAYGPDARQAIERLHAAMTALQEKTIRHVLAIRALLTPSQAKDFDATVSKALGFVPS